MTRVTLATTCMDRLKHLRRTLSANIEACELDDTELLVLDYGSRDGLDDWMRRSMRLEMSSGRLRYVRMVDPVPRVWRANHAKNVAALCARGNVLVNVDADNFVNHGFDAEAWQTLKDGGCFCTAPRSRSKCVAGRLGLKMQDFVDLGGYDEDLKNWGYTDADLAVRAGCAGLSRRCWSKLDEAPPIDHGDEDRFVNGDAESLNSSWNANQQRSLSNRHACRLRANESRTWGQAVVEVNLVRIECVGVLPKE